MGESTTFDSWFSFAEVVTASIMLIKKVVLLKRYTHIWTKKALWKKEGMGDEDTLHRVWKLL